MAMKAPPTSQEIDLTDISNNDFTDRRRYRWRTLIQTLTDILRVRATWRGQTLRTYGTYVTAQFWKVRLEKKEGKKGRGVEERKNCTGARTNDAN